MSDEIGDLAESKVDGLELADGIGPIRVSLKGASPGTYRIIRTDGSQDPVTFQFFDEDGAVYDERTAPVGSCVTVQIDNE
jgi:hypothetical protein